jgi:hypothetical protein
MAIWKMTMLFSQLSAASAPQFPVHRIGGWSESWYTVQNGVNDVINQASVGNGILLSRAALLGFGASIVGGRVQMVNPVGATQSFAALYPGIPTVLNDIPQMALLMKAPGVGVGNVRRFTLRGIPDTFVSEGEFSPNGTFQGQLSTFINSLQGWFFRGRDLTQPTVKILNISSGGVVTCQTAVSFALLQMVQILKSKDSGSNLRGGMFQVSTLGPGSNVFTLLNWPYGATVGGTARGQGVVFPAVDYGHTSVSRVVTRRVGRPFTAYRGRRSKRR